MLQIKGNNRLYNKAYHGLKIPAFINLQMKMKIAAIVAQWYKVKVCDATGDAIKNPCRLQKKIRNA